MIFFEAYGRERVVSAFAAKAYSTSEDFTIYRKKTHVQKLIFINSQSTKEQSNFTEPTHTKKSYRIQKERFTYYSSTFC